MFVRRLLALQKCRNYPINPIFRRAMSHNSGGIPGENLPFRRLIGNPTRCMMIFIVFFGTGLWVPCVAFVYLMHKD